MKQCLQETQAIAEAKKRDMEETLLSHKREEEMKFVKQKLEAKAKAELATEKPASKSQVRMPKLTITKYDGSFAKWLSFWNKFKA